MLVSNETVLLIRSALHREAELSLPAEGNSMFPFIKQGHICRFVHCRAEDLQIGDIALFHTTSGRLVAHRYYRTLFIGGRWYCLLKGDSNVSFDEPVPAGQIIGKMLVNGWPAAWWSRLIVSLPMLSRILRIYVNRKEQG